MCLTTNNRPAVMKTMIISIYFDGCLISVVPTSSKGVGNGVGGAIASK